MNELITKLINLLELSDDDVLRALLSVYSPCQPGALRQSWNSRKNYGPAPSSFDIWSIYEKYDFRCVNCKSQYRISLDHINDDKHDSDIKNLQVLCQSCNRAKQKRGVKNKDLQIKVYKSLIELNKLNNEIPNAYKVHKHINVKCGGSSESLLKFLIHRLKQKQLSLK